MKVILAAIRVTVETSSRTTLAETTGQKDLGNSLQVSLPSLLLITKAKSTFRWEELVGALTRRLDTAPPAQDRPLWCVSDVLHREVRTQVESGLIIRK